MSLGISDLAHSVRKNSAATDAPITLGHAQQLFAAALGYKTFAAYQAAQANAQEPTSLVIVHHVVLDNDMLGQRADELGIVPTPDRLRELIDTAFRERARHARIHPSYAAFEDYLRQYVDRVVTDDEDVNNEMANANYDGVDEVYFDFEVEPEKVSVGGALDIDLDGHVGLGLDTERPYAGHIVNVEGTLSVKRLGRQCFGSVDCQVTKANLDTDCTASSGSCAHRLFVLVPGAEACPRTVASVARWLTTCWAASSRPMRRTRNGWPTSPTSGQQKAGCTWQRCWTCTRVASWAGRCKRA